MRKIASLLVAVVMASFCSVASGTPTARYFPDTGRLIFWTDPGVDLGVVSFKSNAGTLLPPAASVLPGSNRDTGDLPYYLLFYNVPANINFIRHDLGNIVIPGTPVSDLPLGYFVTFGDGRERVGHVEQLIPEPTTLTMGCLALISLAALARGRRRLTINAASS